MGIRTVKPTSAGRRFQTYATFEEITTDRPEKSLMDLCANRAAATMWAGLPRGSAEAATSGAIA